MKKIVHINVSLNKGSTGRIAEQICLLAEKKGFDCTIVHGPIAVNDSKLKSIECGNRFTNRLHALFTRLFDLEGRCSYFSTRRVIKKLKVIDPDIIHLHVIHEHYINYPLLFRYLSESRAKVVWTMHDCWAFTGHCCHFDYYGCQNWMLSCQICKFKSTYPRAVLSCSRKNYAKKKGSFLSVSNKLTIVPVSHWLEHFLEDSMLKRCNVQTIHNGTNLHDFIVYNTDEVSAIKKKYKLCGRQVVIGCAANWEERKGFKDFVEIRKNLDDTVDVLLVGLNENQMDQATEAGIIGIKRTEDVHELAKLYALSDVFVNPTYEDNFPTTNIESLACGTPIVTYNTGGSPEAIDEGTGYVVEKGATASLVTAIVKVLANGKCFYTDKCRKRAEQYFDMNDRYQEYINLYNHILDEKEK